MKNLIKYFIALVVLGTNTVYAQKPSIDSPHNYKRPVFQQKKVVQQGSRDVVFSQNQSEYQFKNNINSVHNYKRKGVRDFTSELPFTILIPVKNEIAFNPLLSSHNYKAHFVTTEFGKRMITNANKKEYDTLSLN